MGQHGHERAPSPDSPAIFTKNNPPKAKNRLFLGCFYAFFSPCDSAVTLFIHKKQHLKGPCPLAGAFSLCTLELVSKAG